MSQEAEELAGKLELFFAFMAERARDSSVLTRMRQNLTEYANAGELKKLKRLEKEINTRIRDTFSDDDKAELNRRWGHSHVADDARSVEQVVSRGRIISDDEFQLVESFVNRHFAEPALRTCVELCNSLLARYCKKQ